MQLKANNFNKFIHFSVGNVPSMWANTMQTMKMAEAFAQCLPNYELVTQISYLHKLFPKFNYENWYGINKPFTITELPQWFFTTKRYFDDNYYHKKYYNTYLLKAIQYAVKQQPNLVFSRNLKIIKGCIQNNIPAILETHDDPEKFDYLKDLIMLSTSPYFKGMATIHNHLKQGYVKIGVPEQKIVVAADAVDTTIFDKLPTKTELRKQLKLPPNTYIATYTGHLYSYRGIEEIIAAAKALPHITFVLAGGWDTDVETRKKEAQGLNNVFFTGFVPNAQIPSYLKAADVLLMPYSINCKTAAYMSPMKLFEYMASNTPIIASNLNAIQLHLHNLKNGILCQPDNYISLVQSIQTIYNNPLMAKALASQAYLDVQPFSWHNRALNILQNFAPEFIAKKI